MNAYDIMALLCKKIRSLNEDTQHDLFVEYFKIIKTKDDVVENDIEFLSKRDGVLTSFDSLTEYQINRIIEKIENKNSIFWLCLLIYIDDCLPVEENLNRYCDAQRIKGQNIYFFSHLSKNDAGLLIPNFHPKWQKKESTSLDELNNDLCSILKNYLWIDKLDKWNVMNFYSPKWSWKNNNDPYCIVCSPLSNACPFTISPVSPEENRFFIKYYSDEKQQNIKTCFEKTLKFANEKKASIVFFPELMVSQETQNNLAGIIDDHWEYEYPRIIYLPSSFINENGEYYNQTKALNGSGEEIFTYNKQHPFQLKATKVKQSLSNGDEFIFDRYFEAIKRDYNIQIIHINGIGRIGLVICADIFDDQIQDILFQKYKINLLLIMSYTLGTNFFIRTIGSAFTYVCDVVWCNTCAAYENDRGEKIAVEYFSYGHKKHNEHKISRCNMNMEECNGCAVCVELSLVYDGDAHIQQEFF